MNLLSCPFCGGKGEMTMEKHNSYKSYFVSCEDCNAQGTGFDKTYVQPHRTLRVNALDVEVRLEQVDHVLDLVKLVTVCSHLFLASIQPTVYLAILPAQCRYHMCFCHAPDNTGI